MSGWGEPYLDGTVLADRLNRREFPGVDFRACFFEPTFQKHAGTVCGGVQVHVNDRERFEPVRTALAVLYEARTLAPDRFAWRPPPYEYETKKMPIDILWGSSMLRTMIEDGAEPDDILAASDDSLSAFGELVSPFLLY